VKIRPPKHGEWWRLGAHLLYCGSSIDTAFVERVKRSGARLAFCDPDSPVSVNWDHDYLIDYCRYVIVMLPHDQMPHFYAHVTGMPYRWSVAAEIENGFMPGPLGSSRWLYMGLFSFSNDVNRNISDHFSVELASQPQIRPGFPEPKPMELMTELIGGFTEEHDGVIDPFMGTGTTLFAAEKLNRRCVGAEFKPAICLDIITTYNAMKPGYVELLEG
jgi:hypothetical protein